ncbi:MAG: hypothetical protein IJT57_06290 [Selenomonadaceae bacterium]|nr:hypothetical protein [Selenomonadaceae bacterium]MBQ7723919.1 hypothetical protein [Selenomonadaceae bacterium]
MATADRFKEVVESGIIMDADDMEAPLSPQMKYDLMAAINSIEQLESLIAEIANRKQYRAKLKAELLKSCCQSLKKLAEDEKNFTMKKIDAAIKMLTDCRYEITKIDSAERETEKLSKLVRKGVSA